MRKISKFCLTLFTLAFAFTNAMADVHYYKGAVQVAQDGNGQTHGKVYTFDAMGAAILNSEFSTLAGFESTIDMQKGKDGTPVFTNVSDESYGFLSTQLKTLLCEQVYPGWKTQQAPEYDELFTTMYGMDFLLIPEITFSAQGDPGWACDKQNIVAGTGNVAYALPDYEDVFMPGIPVFAPMDVLINMPINTEIDPFDASKVTNVLDLGTWTVNFLQTRVISADEQGYGTIYFTDPNATANRGCFFSAENYEKVEDFICELSSNLKPQYEEYIQPAMDGTGVTVYVRINPSKKNGEHVETITLASASNPDEKFVFHLTVNEHYVPDFKTEDTQLTFVTHTMDWVGNNQTTRILSKNNVASHANTEWTATILGQDADEFEVVSVDGTAVTVNYKHAAVGTHNATLRVTANYDGETKSVDVALSGTTEAGPRTPQVTWNWNYLFFGSTNTTPITSNSDGAVTITKVTDVANLVTLNGTTATVAVSGTKSTATFHISIAATDNYMAWEQDYEAIIMADARVLPLNLLTEDEFNVITLGTNIEFNATNHGPKVKNSSSDKVWTFAVNGVPDILDFVPTYNEGNINWAIWESEDNETWTQTYHEAPFRGSQMKDGRIWKQLRPTTRFIRVKIGTGTMQYVRVSKLETVRADRNEVAISTASTTAQQTIHVYCPANNLLTAVCSNASFSAAITKVGQYEADVTITYTGTKEELSSVEIKLNGVTKLTLPIVTYDPGAVTPMNLTTDANKYSYYNAICASEHAIWNADNRSITFENTAKEVWRSVTFYVNGTPGEIYFNHDATGAISTYDSQYGNWKVEESADGNTWNSNTNFDKTTGIISQTLDPTTRYIRISHKNNYYCRPVTLSNISITEGVAACDGVCTVGNNCFATLEDALAYANNNKDREMTIVLQKDYTLPAGNYTLPQKATLLIPYYDGQTEATGKTPISTTNYVSPTVYRTLTLAKGVNLNVFGTIEAGAKDYCNQPELTAVSGPYGHIKLNEGSLITLNDGAILRAYGFVTGKGMVDVHYGADTYEFFQVGDWKGGSASIEMIDEDNVDKGVFIVNQYFFHNIESPITYRPGSHAWGELDVQVYGEAHIVTDVMVIGLSTENTMFKMDEDKASDKNVWVRRTYDYQTDHQVYDINSSAYLGSMVISAMGFEFNSANFVLPITSNMKIHLLSGSMGITENTLLLPGAEIEVDKESMVSMAEHKNLYLFDADEWGNYVFSKGMFSCGTSVRYSPSWTKGCPRDVTSAQALGDAKINVHGTFRADGNVFVTEGGANIFSTNEDAGSVYFTTKANSTNSKIWQVIGINPEVTFESKTAIPMLLHNEDGSFAQTAGTEAGMSYCYFGNKWRLMTIDKDNDCFVYDNYGVYYAKPSGYVAINTSKNTKGEFVTNPDHTFSDANGDGRLFILMSNDIDCQWWEVEIKDNMYYCAKNNKYYYYNEDNERWEEQTFTITWKNWNGETLKNADGDDAIYNVTYGTTPVYLGTNPTREEGVDYTYDFIGWTPEIVPVSENAVYTAHFEKKERKYTVIFQNEKGGEIERHFYKLGEFPVCENLPTKTVVGKSYTLIWTPALSAVIGDATYKASFVEDAPSEYEVRFVNYDGYELQQGNVAVGTTPEYTGGTPTKPATDEYTYEFAGWSPELKPVDAAITYTATFNEVGKTYAIRFLDENDNELQSEMLAYGVVPTAPEYSKPADAQFTYTLVWTPTITAVNKAQDYEANFTPTTNKYTVTVNAIGCVVEGAGVYEYGKPVKLHITDASVPGFNKDAKWKHTGNSEDITFIVKGNVTYIAEATATTNIVAEIGGEPVKVTTPTEAASFTIKANATASGQVNGAENIELVPAGKAYFEYDFNAQAMKWYAFAVPFVCDANTLRNATRTLTPGVDYDIMEYNGAIRAGYTSEEDERSAWEYISDKGINVLTPGHLYMILFAKAQNTITFTKTASASIVYTAPVTMNQYPAVDDLNANWNGVANPKLFYANLGTGVEYGQIYNGGDDDSYTPKKLSEYDFPVGKPVFVQASNTQSQVIVTPTASAAPLRRMLKADKQECEISLMQGNKECDNLSIIMNDEAEDRYVIGEDLAKAGVSTKVAQMWINRYNAKLCVNSIAAEDEVATYPLGISAPKTGAYTIVATSVPANTAVYLTEDDNIIADLTAMPYTLDLSKGTHNEFGLRMVGKTQPSVVTDFQEASINGKEVQKVIKNNTLYILRADKVFNAQGQLVK